MLTRILVTAAALVSAASAQLTVTNPSSDSWWVAQSSNTLAWTCNTSPYNNFTVLLANSNPSILVEPIAIIAIQESYDCSQTITQQQSTQPAASGYTVLLANPLNSSDVYATSETFEIKALGSSYPATSSASSPSGTSSSSSPSSTGKSGGALAQYIPAGASMVLALAAGLVVA
ncbi:hypothetical protein EDD16DRAFT_1693964 [Pisolithus croceorrhizus]|nr:hypothetical protein F5141DRAFT_1189667 [Pisolithus sp. B1]KAI6112117.1 hypothetical protein EDD16DRAFT_1693964 [Pisolithus croceorrhizus]KAI6118638.1 hypothetical protein EV401DRAFT_2233073 [Pisolithus croceorrhizus]KAI6138424.1 hypothetical protein EDD17DRAFT_1770934 [Pisolithus thermaeus]